ncbi:MAG: AmmeMemoRadiSam system protein A [Clostridia bacterium]
MNAVRKAYIMPHPPVIIPEIGRGSEKEAFRTIEGCNSVAADIASLNPETIIIITPHGPVFRDSVCINTNPVLKGDFGGFGFRQLAYEFDNDTGLCSEICSKLYAMGIIPVSNDRKSQSTYGINDRIDHGALVPLYFVLEFLKEFRIVHITFGMLSPPDLYKCGMAIEAAVKQTGRKACVIASADLSHRLKKEGPYGLHPDGKVYDAFAVDAIKNRRFVEFLGADEDLRDNAGECGHRSINIMLGVFEGRECRTEVFSYEGPFGVGYMTAVLEDTGKGISVLDEFLRRHGAKKPDIESPYVLLARMAIEEFARNRKRIHPDKPSRFQRGVFVSIKKFGILRGCIGTIGPTEDCIENEIIDNAIKAASEDPRFPPVGEAELEDLTISVDVLSEPEEIIDKSMLDVKKYGVIVSKGFKRGLLLPDIDGVDTVDKQIEIALRKAGIDGGDDYRMERFKVERHI